MEALEEPSAIASGASAGASGPDPSEPPDAGDGAGEAAGGGPGGTLDYWEIHPARGALARIHVDWRKAQYLPRDLPDKVELDSLQETRVTQREYADGSADVEVDKWAKDETPRGRERVGAWTPGAWRGTTWFFLEGVATIPGPARKRVTSKRAPLFVTEEWEYLKKL